MAQIPFTNGSCPNCGKRLSDYNPNTYLYGSPIRYCKKCKGAYVDRNYHEIAIDGFPKEEMKASTGLKTALFGLIVSVVSAGIFLCEIIFSEYYHTIFPILAIVGIVMIILGIVDSIRVKSGSKAGSMEKLRQESIQRLQNVQYAMQLAELGYNVPRQYLPEGYVRPAPQPIMPNMPMPQYQQSFNQPNMPMPQPNPQSPQPAPTPQPYSPQMSVSHPNFSQPAAPQPITPQEPQQQTEPAAAPADNAQQ